MQGETHQIHHTFALFDSPQMGNLMIPEICIPPDLFSGVAPMQLCTATMMLLQ